MDHSMTIPYGFHGAYGMRKWLGPQPKVIPYGFHGMAHGFHGFHGFHMDYTGEDKDLGKGAAMPNAKPCKCGKGHAMGFPDDDLS